jgi:hypothetical protein
MYLYFVLLLVPQPLHNDEWKPGKKEYALMDHKAPNGCQLEISEVVDQVLRQQTTYDVSMVVHQK